MNNNLISPKKAWTISKINFKQSRLAYLITGIVFASMLVSLIVDLCIPAYTSETIGLGDIGLLLAVLGAVFIASLHFSKFTQLGATKSDYFFGTALTYLIASAAITFANFFIFYTVENLFRLSGMKFLNLYSVFGWETNGILLGFLQMFAFTFALMSFSHTLTAAQTRWTGWLADIIIVAIISVFTPIEPLRNILATFFYLLIFAQPAIQIFFALVFGIAVYSLNLLILRNKQVK